MHWAGVGVRWLGRNYATPFTVLAFATIFGNLLPTKALAQNFLLWPAALMLAIVLHEAAHALVAWLAGLRVLSVSLGTGRQLGIFTLGGIEVRVHLVLTSGFVMWLAPPELKTKRLSVWFAVLAGPATTLSLCIAAWNFAPEEIFAWWRGFVPLSVFFWANVSLLPNTLLPYSRENGFMTDAYRLFFVPRMTDAQFAQHLVIGILMQISRLLETGDLDEVERLIRETRVQHPGTLSLDFYEGSLLLARARYADGYALYKSMYATANKRPLVTLLQNNMAWALFLERNPERLAEALDLSAQALKNDPEAAHVNNTRGAVLYWSGEYLNATDHLEHAHFNASSPQHRAFIECVLAMAYAKHGEKWRAEEWLRAAEKSDRTCPLFAEATGIVNAASPHQLRA